jgi:transposase
VACAHFCVACLSPAPAPVCAPRVRGQEFCQQCGDWTGTAGRSRHQLCQQCKTAEYHPSSATAATPPPSEPSPPLSLFGRPTGCIDQLTEVERAAIVTLHKVGWTGGDIAQALKCSENTVSLWVHRWDETRSLDDAERSGRPRCTTDDTDQDIMLHADAHVGDNPKDIIRELELDVSARTVRRRLNEVDLHSCVQRSEHENVRARIAFAEGYSRWTADDWCRVLFSDETHFYLGHHGREYVQRPPGAALDPKYTRKDNERLQGKVSLWGCICAGGLGHAELYVDTLDARRYQTILGLNLVSSAHQFWPQGQWWFQQDNWTVHTAGTSREWFHNHGVDLIDWPAWSPDLNPIEELWNDLKHRVYGRHPKTMEQLELFITQEWADTDLNFIQRICSNMPHRLQRVIDNGGHKIPY